MQAPSDAAHSLRGAGLLLGMALGGFFDGILLHQMLQWHHLLSGAGGVEAPGVAGMQALDVIGQRAQRVVHTLLADAGVERCVQVPGRLLVQDARRRDDLGRQARVQQLDLDAAQGVEPGAQANQQGAAVSVVQGPVPASAQFRQ